MSGPFVYAATQDLGLVDFRPGVLDPRITFTRASTGTYFDAAGVMQTAAINAPRFDHHPATLKRLGLLVEPQRTNLLLRSQEFDNAAWNKSDSTVTANAVVAPDGTISADKLVEAASTAVHYVNRTGTLTASTTYALSVYAKAAERSRVQLAGSAGSWSATLTATFDLAAGTVVSSSWVAASIVSVGNGWYRCTVVGTTNAAPASSQHTQIVLIQSGTTQSYLGDGTSGLYVWGAQLEAGAWPSSYIPTTTATVTRSADVCTGTPSDFGVIDAEGTMYAEYSYAGGSSADAPNNRFVLGIDAGTNANRHLLYNTSFGGIQGLTQVASATTGLVSVAGTVGANGALVKAAYAYKANDFQGAAQGSTSAVDSSGAVPTSLLRVLFGGPSGASSAGAHMRLVQFYPRRLSTAVLAKLTS
jgi:hypothetical protein